MKKKKTVLLELIEGKTYMWEKRVNKEKLLFLTKFGVDDKFILSCLNPLEDFYQ